MRRFLDLASGVLLFSAFMDLYVWVTMAYHVPSWAMSVMTLGSAVLCQVIKKVMK